jgi:hypothetical protein
MSNNILVCLDDLEHSKKIATYVSNVMGNKKNMKLTLFHCIPSDDIDLGASELELNEYDKVSIDRMLAEYYQDKKDEEVFNCQDVFNSAREILKQSGFNDNNIKEKLVVKDMEISACILREAYNHNYDTIVIAKRRNVKIPITKLGVVTENVLTNAIGKTIILVSIAAK